MHSIKPILVPTIDAFFVVYSLSFTQTACSLAVYCTCTSIVQAVHKSISYTQVLFTTFVLGTNRRLVLVLSESVAHVYAPIILQNYRG